MTLQRRIVLFATGACAGTAATALFYRWRLKSAADVAQQQPQPPQLPQPSATPPVPWVPPPPLAPTVPAGPAPPIQPDSQPITPASAELMRQVFKFGFPGPINDIRFRDAYIASYDRERKNANWVVERITKDTLQRGSDADRANSQFVEDNSIPEKFRVSLKDYHRSGYDRGHLVPAADAKFNQRALDETFIMTNISPQIGKGFNRDYWAWVENFCRSLAKKFSEVYVYTGPLYLPDPVTKVVKYPTIGTGSIVERVAVPTHFFKVILAVDGNGFPEAIGGFVLPNAPILESEPLEKFSVKVEDIEKASGLEFFDKIDKKKAVPLCRKVTCVAVPTKHHIDQLEAAARLKKLAPPPEVKALPPPDA